MSVTADTPVTEAFESFVAVAEPRLRHALVAAVGRDLGRDAAAEALAFGWEHWDDIKVMENPIGYLYRVGRSRVRVPIPPIATSGPTPDRLPGPCGKSGRG
jgi:hypothetical protein